MKTIELTDQEAQDLKQLMQNLETYYGEPDRLWDFQDLDNQREIALEMAKILNDKI